jgi:hypothetical protein
MLQTKQVEIDGETFEFREPTIEAMLPVLKKLGNEELRMEAQVDILKLCVFKNGEPVGDQIGISKLSDFAPHALSVCGMGEDESD